MTTFAKIHESEEHGQILITNEYEPDSEKYIVRIWFNTINLLCKVGYSSEMEETAAELFKKMTLEESEHIINKIKSQIQ